MSENSLFALFFFPSLAAVLIFSMKYVAAILQAKFRLSQDEAYREMAAKTAAAQAEMVEGFSAMQNTLVDIQLKLASLEKILKDVE
ncbi:MAG TPA: hypothetical protein PKE57_01950 [Cellvibrionaceae bacterium]|nr:hypothetical protein [Cellvibrionaceae bacterium]HMW47083.1 hypothetical protein [Cellvibrionaceae bacterium]HMW72052.1 hypothetical protein [Cellvibrionaceae bacterium]HMY40852.1 hypothetical protein [Marinagarivorans sp.]HNG59633.1 hypothetical protein [Cellvibrionaceae bacterium]